MSSVDICPLLLALTSQLCVASSIPCSALGQQSAPTELRVADRAGVDQEQEHSHLRHDPKNGPFAPVMCIPPKRRQEIRPVADRTKNEWIRCNDEHESAEEPPTTSPSSSEAVGLLARPPRQPRRRVESSDRSTTDLPATRPKV